MLIGLTVGAAFLTSPMLFSSGGVTRTLKVTVRDQDGRILSGARVALIQGFDERIRPIVSEKEFSEHLEKAHQLIVTDKHGGGILMGQFGAVGTLGPFGRSGRFLVRGDIMVTHEGFSDLTLPLANFTGDSRISIWRKTLEFTVFIKRKQAEQVATSDPH